MSDMPTQNWQKCTPIFLKCIHTHIHVLMQRCGGGWGGVSAAALSFKKGASDKSAHAHLTPEVVLRYSHTARPSQHTL